MNMNSRQVAKKERKAFRTLFAGLLITATMSSWADTPIDLIPSELPPAYFDPSDLTVAPQWPEENLRIDVSEVTDELISLSEESWDVSESPGARLSRPIKEASRFCRDCEFQIGVGGTYHAFKGTSGTVIPLTVTWDRSRWEFGVFHFTKQTSSDNQEHTEQLVAHPYWGASLSRRFHFLDRGPLRAFFGFGVSYKTEQDILSVTHWNFSSQLGVRFQSPNFPAIFELSARHWSNGGVKTPNRGQDFSILTVRFDL